MAYFNPIPLFAPAFVNPNAIPGLKLWLEAGVGVFHDAGITPATDGQTVQQWNDQSSNGKNASQSSAGLRPTFRASVGGNPAIQFSSSQMLAGGNADFAETSFSVFAVVNWNGNTSAPFQAVVNKGDGVSAANSVWGILLAEGANPAHKFSCVRLDTFYGSTNNNDIEVGQFTGQDTLVTAIRVDNNTKHGYFNGNLVSTGGDAGNSLNAGATALGIGDGTTSGHLVYVGYIREILYYSGAVSDANRQTVEGYLRRKYSISPPSVPVMASFNTADGVSAQRLYVVQSTDGLNWTTPAGVTNPTFIPFGAGGVGTTTGTSGDSLLFHNGVYWWAYEYNNVSAAVKAFGIAKSSSLAGPWTWVTDVNILASTTNGYVWNPRWFIDDDASIHIICNACNSANMPIQTLPMQPFIVDCLNTTTMASWSAATAITGSGGFPPAICIDFFCVSPAKSPNGKYNLFYKDQSTQLISYSSSTSLKSGYTPTVSDVFGFQGEGVYLIKLGTTWRAYFSDTSGGVWSYFDSLDNWATWSAQPTDVLGPVVLGGEWLLTTG